MTPEVDGRVLNLIRQSAEWRLLSLLLECPSDSWRAQVSDLASTVKDPLLSDACKQALEQADEGLYHSAFGPGGPAAPREVSYSDSVQLGYLLSELEAYYEAFAYRPRTGEAADHISVETGFMAFLFLKEAYALTSGHAESASITADAGRDFQREHLSWIVEPLAARLEDSSIGYLAATGRALLERVGPSRQRMAYPGNVLPVIPAEAEFVCGNDDGIG